MSMNFLDETDDWPEYRTVREEIYRLERERTAILDAFREAESASASDPGNLDLRARVDALRTELRAIEKSLDESLSMYR